MTLSYIQAIAEAVKQIYDNGTDYPYLGSEVKHSINQACYLIAVIYDKPFVKTKRKFAQQDKEHYNKKIKYSYCFWHEQMERQEREEEAAKNSLKRNNFLFRGFTAPFLLVQ